MDTHSPADQVETFDADEARAALAHASVIISSFRWKLRDAGYPFREPPEVDALLARIDRILFPELQTRVTRKREGPRILQTPAAIAAAEALHRLSAQG
jgi:hypothetical protein